MAKSRIPSPLERRHLIERELSEPQAVAIAEAYLEEGRDEEAVVFLAKGGATDRLDELSERAIEHGDGFLLRSIAAASGVEPSAQAWERLAAAARAAGKDLYAETAERQANRGED